MIRKFIISLVVMLFMSCPLILADDISFEARVDSNEIALGNSTHLTLKVTGTQKVDPIELPAIDGFDTRYLAPQTEISIINGNYTASKSFIYVLFTTKTGTFTVPSIKALIDGKEYQTEPITITVTDAASPTAQAPTSGSPSALSMQDKIMLKLEVPKTEVYLHEQVPINVRLYIADVRVDKIQYPALDTTGFTMTNFVDEQYQQVLNGMGFNVVDFKAMISPTRAGAVQIGPAQIQGEVLTRSQNQLANNSFGSEFFDGFFTSYDRRGFTASSAAMTINVLPLPEEGKPQDFSGAVGKYDFVVTATPEIIKVGDPITLRMKIQGDGDLKTITMPSFTNSAFKIYDPQIKDEGNSKIMEQVIIPTTTEIKEVPAISFSYFNTQTRQYETITQGPFPIVVSAPDAGQEFKAVGFETSKMTEPVKEEVGRDIIFIKENLDGVHPVGYRFYKTWWFGSVIVLYLCTWLSGFIFYFIRQKMKTDSRFARKIKAPRHARQGLDQAIALIDQNNPKEYYAHIIRTLTDYIGNRLHVSSGGLTAQGVKNLLSTKAIGSNTVKQIEHLFEVSDSVRFASAKCDQKMMRDDLEVLKSVISVLEKSL